MIIYNSDYTKVRVLDEKGAGNANHEYTIISDEAKKVLAHISFQNGPIKENGVNGVQNEDLLAIVKNRLDGFQDGDFACLENQIALDNINSALNILKYRTNERKKRNVEGKNIK